MNVAGELNLIEEVGAAAWSFVMEGQFQSARRALAKIKHSHCLTESERVIAIVEAKILQRCGRLDDAKARILKSIGFLWSSAEGFEILAAGNPKSNEQSKEYYIEILGGRASIANFLTFTDKHIASFDVIANSEAEALGYIESICNFSEPQSRMLLESREREIDIQVHPRRGVMHAYPFRLERLDT